MDEPGDERGEDVVVVRFEGLGAFAVPVAELEGYRLPVVADDEGNGSALAATEAVPVILGEDFLRGVTPDRNRLVVDRFGGVARSDLGPIFLPRREEGR